MLKLARVRRIVASLYATAQHVENGCFEKYGFFLTQRNEMVQVLFSGLYGTIRIAPKDSYKGCEHNVFPMVGVRLMFIRLWFSLKRFFTVQAA